MRVPVQVVLLFDRWKMDFTSLMGMSVRRKHLILIFIIVNHTLNLYLQTIFFRYISFRKSVDHIFFASLIIIKKHLVSANKTLVRLRQWISPCHVSFWIARGARIWVFGKVVFVFIYNPYNATIFISIKAGTRNEEEWKWIYYICTLIDDSRKFYGLHLQIVLTCHRIRLKMKSAIGERNDLPEYSETIYITVYARMVAWWFSRERVVTCGTFVVLCAVCASLLFDD